MSYEPNSLDPEGLRESAGRGFRTSDRPIDGNPARLRWSRSAERRSQARLFYRSQSELEQKHIAQALIYQILKRSSADRFSFRTWTMVHLRGSLSGRHRKNFVHDEKRPPEKWSNCTSATNLVFSASHSIDSFVLQRLGRPGDLPVNPGGPDELCELPGQRGRSSSAIDNRSRYGRVFLSRCTSRAAASRPASFFASSGIRQQRSPRCDDA